MTEPPTELSVRAELDEVVRDFTQRFPDNTYDYKIGRYINIFDGSNWAVTATGSTAGGDGAMFRFDQALQAVHDRNRILR